MAGITVHKATGDRYVVTVGGGGGRTEHQVTATLGQIAELGGDRAPEDVIEASFEFLLEREPKESILSSFELPVIGRYFPEYPAEIRSRLSD